MLKLRKVLKIFDSIGSFSPVVKTVLTLGTFDGVHKGHRAILEKLVLAGKAHGCETVVLTFFPHPRMVLQQSNDIKLLNTMQEKAMLLESFGIDNLIVHPFDHTFSRLTAEDFVKDILVGRLNIAEIIIGYDHRFGRNRTATIDDLIFFGERYGFGVSQISATEINEVSVSSTKIRNALAEGNVAVANSFLGYPYFLTGTVAKGRQLGRTIGYPTANIDIKEEYKLIPAIGAYVASATVSGRKIAGMMNIGHNPTVGSEKLAIEIHLFDFDDDIYDASIQVSLHARLRSEIKFESVDALRRQLSEDKKLAIAYFEQNPLR